MASPRCRRHRPIHAHEKVRIFINFYLCPPIRDSSMTYSIYVRSKIGRIMQCDRISYNKYKEKAINSKNVLIQLDKLIAHFIAECSRGDKRARYADM